MVTLVCLVCQTPFQVKPYRAKDAKYCSRECIKKAYKGRKPPNAGIYYNQVELICEYCGEKFYREASRLKHGRGKHCSRKCQYAARRAMPKLAAIDFTCLNCGSIFTLTKSRLQSTKGAGKYCCRKCRDEHWIKENHPQFINGDRSNWHGPNWYSQRRKALKRDKDICQGCRLTKSQSLEKFGQSLAVHHRIPFRLFNGDYLAANDLDNLVTLCHGCHRIREAKFQASEQNLIALPVKNPCFQLPLF